jgi:hypothetical protein
MRLLKFIQVNQHLLLFSFLKDQFTPMSYSTHAYLSHSFPLLPHPSSGANPIPFHTQAMPIPDPLQQHPTLPQRNVVTSPYNQSNQLVYGRFLGTFWPQLNQPHFLGANERVVFEDSW